MTRHKIAAGHKERARRPGRWRWTKGYSRRTFCSWQDAGWSPAESITVDVGDTRVVPQHVTAGWWGTATALPAVHAALLELHRQLGLPKPGRSTCEPR